MASFANPPQTQAYANGAGIPLPLYRRVLPANWKTSKRFLKSDYFPAEQRQTLSAICGIPKSQRTEEQKTELSSAKSALYVHEHPGSSARKSELAVKIACGAFALFSAAALIGSAANAVISSNIPTVLSYAALILVAAAGIWAAVKFVKPNKKSGMAPAS